MAFPFLTIFIIFVVFLSIRYSTVKRKTAEKYENFWANEERANHIPAKDLSTIEYLHIPVETFPFDKWDDDEIQMIEQQIKEYSEKRVLNLSGKTNTELKLEYGTANLEAMTEIGDNYNTLIVLLVDYAKALMERSDYEDAAKILEFSASTKSDISTNYMLLGDCYAALNQKKKIPVLKDQVESLHLMLEHKIIAYLDELLNTDDSPEDFSLDQ